MRSEDFAILAHDNLNKAFGFTTGNSFTVSYPGETLDLCLGIFLFSLRLGQAHKGHFWEGIDGVSDDIIIHDRVVTHGIIGGNLAFCLSNVSKASAMKH